MDQNRINSDNDEYSENAYYLRGKLIDTFNTMEKCIESFIVNYFMPNNSKMFDFQSIILDRLIFQSKKEVFFELMKQEQRKRGFIKRKNNAWPYSRLFKDITEMQDERNRFAHYYLAKPSILRDEVIVLIEFRDSVKLHRYNQIKYNDLIERVKSLVDEITNIGKI